MTWVGERVVRGQKGKGKGIGDWQRSDKDKK